MTALATHAGCTATWQRNRSLSVSAVARPSIPRRQQQQPRPIKTAARALTHAAGATSFASVASVDGGSAVSNPLTETYNKAVDLSSLLLGGYPQTGSIVTHHAMRRFRATKTPIARYLFLRDLQLFSPLVYFHMLMTRTEELLPYIYTPTVGQACQEYHELPMLTQGLYVSLRDRGNVLKKLKAWKQQDVKVAVVTDGGRILGLGDLGCNGMGISEGKIQLYTAAAGVNPSHCLPVCIDVGTDNEVLLADPKYKGLRQRRATGKEYYSFMDEFMSALAQWQPHMLVQLEDFATEPAFQLLRTYQDRACVFDDDVQGTACVTVASILSALRANGHRLKDQRILFFGAGEAGTGIGELLALALVKQAAEEGVTLSLQEARQHCFFMDSKGLVTASRADALAGTMAHHKEPFAHADLPPAKDLLEAVQQLRPSILIGVSTVANAFTQDVCETMAAINARPLIFPLSNPTSKSECSFEQAVTWTNGSVLFASGSPFPAFCYDGCEPLQPTQANNAWVFPAVGHAAVLCKATSIPNEVFLVAAEALSCMTSLDELAHGYLLPPFRDIRAVSARLMAAVCAYMVDTGLGSAPEGFEGDWEATARAAMWDV